MTRQRDFKAAGNEICKCWELDHMRVCQQKVLVLVCSSVLHRGTCQLTLYSLLDSGISTFVIVRHPALRLRCQVASHRSPPSPSLLSSTSTRCTVICAGRSLPSLSLHGTGSTGKKTVSTGATSALNDNTGSVRLIKTSQNTVSTDWSEEKKYYSD